MKQPLVAPEAQIIWYAKYLFKRKSLLEDLRILVADYVGMELKYVKDEFVIQVLYDIFCVYIPEFNRRLILGSTLTEMFVKSLRGEKVPPDEILNPMLSALFGVVCKRNGKVLVNLGKPNYKLLPKSEQS